MQFNKYHKIEQFRNVVKRISEVSSFTGFNEQNEPIHDYTLEKPKLLFTGTVKLHGTNALIQYTPEKGIIAGKRSSLIDKGDISAHMGFNIFVQIQNKDFFILLMSKLWKKYCVEGEQITVYGEWAGQGIQKGVGISKLPKAFYIFDCKVRNIETLKDKWLEISKEPLLHRISPLLNIYSVEAFKTYSIEIDFNNPQAALNTLIQYTQEVEKECPVSSYLAAMQTNPKEILPPFIGEGIVWKSFWKGEKFIFKVKGEKHSISNVKTLTAVDPEILISIQKFVDYAITTQRVLQAISEVKATKKQDTPKVLDWVLKDILAEELDVLKVSNLDFGKVRGACINKIRNLFFIELDKF